jgi:hypothetical protein
MASRIVCCFGYSETKTTFLGPMDTLQGLVVHMLIMSPKVDTPRNPANSCQRWHVIV